MDRFKPPRFPFHTIVVHLPVALWPAALMFDLLSLSTLGGNAIVRLSFFSIAGGLIGALLAVPTGVLDWGGVKKEKPAWKIGLYHMMTNLLVTILFAMNLGLRLPTYATAEKVSGLPLALSALGTLLVFAGAYLGGLMVYEHGVGVARRSKDKWRTIAERSGSIVPPKKEN